MVMFSLLREGAFSVFLQDLQKITHGNRHRLVPPDHDIGMKCDVPFEQIDLLEDSAESSSSISWDNINETPIFLSM